MITVVNKRTDEFDIYIGRGGPFGNPFVIGKDGDRAEVIQKFRAWFLSDDICAMAMRGEAELFIGPDSVLGCFCKPLACHGDVIAEFMNEKYAA